MQSHNSGIPRQTREGKKPDFRLVLARLEQDIVNNRNAARCRRILTKQTLWAQLDAAGQLEWARLAQLAGDMDTALAVLAHINAATPGMLSAWERRLELLITLDRRKEAAKVLELARGQLPAEQHAALVKRCALRDGPDVQDDVAGAAGPFVRLNERRAALAHFLKLFGGRGDCFARQWADKNQGRQGYVPVRRAMDLQDVEDHLAGRRTYGIYLLEADATVRTAVIDADLARRFLDGRLKAEDRRLVWRERRYLMDRVIELAGAAGLKPLTEFSGGKGYHFWFFFDRPVPAGTAKTFLESIRGSLAGDLSAFSLEVFPKQAGLSGKGLGNLVKLPLGIHRLSGKRSFFTDCTDRSVAAQLRFLEGVQTADAKRFGAAIRRQDTGKLVVHPRFEAWAAKYPQLYTLERRCPPLAQIMAACRSGREISLREEKVLYQTVGFLPARRTLLHHLLAPLPGYNPHMVDYRLSRLRGTPLGCRRIHALTGFPGDFCAFEKPADYAHPLLHLPKDINETPRAAARAENLAAALKNLQLAIAQVHRFMK